MKEFRYSKFLLFFIAVGLIAALVISFQRHEVEKETRTVEMAVDYEGILELAQREGRAPEEVLALTKEAGITSLAVYETTFEKLNKNGKVRAITGGEILTSYHQGALPPAYRALVDAGVIKMDEIYIIPHDMATYREVRADLFRRLGEDRVTPIDVAGSEILAVKAHYKSFLKMNIGMPTDEMRAVNAAGFHVIARPSNYEDCSADDVRAVFSRLDGIDVSAVVFSGKQSLGATKALQTTIDLMRERGLTLGLIEAPTQLQFYKQTGMLEIAHGIGYNHVARLYSIPKSDQPKLKLAEAIERWSNTDEERNIRIDLLRIYETPAPGMSLLETNLAYFAGTHEKIASRGYSFGPAGTFASYDAPRILRALVMVGVAAAVVLYLTLVSHAVNRRPRLTVALFVLFALLAAVPVLMGAGSKIRLVAALASANVFPALAVIAMLDFVRRRSVPELSLPRMIVYSFVALLITGALSYTGAAYLSGSLSDTRYFLEFNIFRGIKLTFVLPIVLVAIAFLQRFDVFDGRFDNTSGVVSQLREILDMPVKVKTLLGLFVLMIAAVIFVARSGHSSGMPVSGLELRFRAFLEQLFYARPRTKELLIGHPAFMLAAMAFLRKWPTMVFFVLVLIATIGQGSMVETFAHMRTPIEMSFWRGIYGIVLGGIIGAILMTLCAIWQTILKKAKLESKGA